MDRAAGGVRVMPSLLCSDRDGLRRLADDDRGDGRAASEKCLPACAVATLWHLHAAAEVEEEGRVTTFVNVRTAVLLAMVLLVDVNLRARNGRRCA